MEEFESQIVQIKRQLYLRHMIDRERERKNKEKIKKKYFPARYLPKWIEFETQTVQIKRRGEETLLAVRNIYLKDIYLNGRV